MIKNIVPPQYFRALEEGEMLLMVANPFDKKIEPIRVGFNKKHVFNSKITPNGQSWVCDTPMMDFPKDVSAEKILEIMIATIMKMAVPIGGATIDIMLADLDNTVNN